MRSHTGSAAPAPSRRALDRLSPRAPPPIVGPIDAPGPTIADRGEADDAHELVARRGGGGRADLRCRGRRGAGAHHLSAAFDAGQRLLAGGEARHGRCLRADQGRLPDGLPAAGRQFPGAAQQPRGRDRQQARPASSSPLPAATSSTRRCSARRMPASRSSLPTSIIRKTSFRQSYVGQDLEVAGYDLAKAQSANFPAEGPIHVLIGVNGPGQVWSETRAAGIERFIKEYQAANTDREVTYERIDAGLDLALVGQRVAAYVQATPTTAYFDTGYWHAGAAVTPPRSRQEAGRSAARRLRPGAGRVRRDEERLHPAHGRPAALPPGLLPGPPAAICSTTSSSRRST